MSTRIVGLLAATVFTGWAGAANALPLFVETFNGGALDNPANWALSSSTSSGRILFDAIPTAQAGTAMWMDVSPSGIQNLNEAILTVDLSVCGSSCELSFFYAEANDEQSFCLQVLVEVSTVTAFQ